MSLPLPPTNPWADFPEGVSDFTGVIPPEFSTQIMSEATSQSAALQLCRRVPMGTTVNQFPVPRGFPKAAWIKTGGRKPFTEVKLGVEQITAEEIAAVIAIPDAVVADSSINLWGYARPLVAEAIARALDDAVFFGTDAPDTFPDGGIAGVAQAADTGVDAVDTINNAMWAIESNGIAPDGFAADIAVRGALRGIRSPDGFPLLGPDQFNANGTTTLYGLPIAYVPFSEAEPDFFVGGWSYAILGVRQDIRYQMSSEGVLVDDDGRVIVSAFQDNATLLKVWARFGFGIVLPGTPRMPDGANPFATATVAGGFSRAHAGPASAGTHMAPGRGGTSGGGTTEPGGQSAQQASARTQQQRGGQPRRNGGTQQSGGTAR